MWFRCLISNMYTSKVMPHPYYTYVTCHYKRQCDIQSITSHELHGGEGTTWKLGDPLLYSENQGYIHNPPFSFIFVTGHQTTDGKGCTKEIFWTTERDDSPFNLFQMSPWDVLISPTGCNIIKLLNRVTQNFNCGIQPYTHASWKLELTTSGFNWVQQHQD